MASGYLNSPPQRHWQKSCAPFPCRAAAISAAQSRAETHRAPVHVRLPVPPGIAVSPSAVCQRCRSVSIGGGCGRVSKYIGEIMT